MTKAARTPRKPRPLPTPAPPGEGAYEFLVPDRIPATANRLLTSHWAVAARMKKTDRLAVALAFKNSGIPTATGKRRVTLTVVLGPRRNKADQDAYWKSTLDALKHCGAIVDDTVELVELAPVAFARADRSGAVVRVEEM